MIEQPVLPQYIIMLGARAALGGESRRVGRFDEHDFREIERIVRQEHRFEGCTIIRGNGFYQGQTEDTVQVIILEANYEKIRACAQELRLAFGQQSVLVVSAGVGEFLT